MTALYVVKHKSLEVLGVVLKCIQHIIHREEIQLYMMYLSMIPSKPNQNREGSV